MNGSKVTSLVIFLPKNVTFHFNSILIYGARIVFLNIIEHTDINKTQVLSPQIQNTLGKEVIYTMQFVIGTRKEVQVAVGKKETEYFQLRR